MKKLIIIFILILESAVQALDFSVYPTRFETDLSKPTIQEIYLLNNTNTSLRIQVFTEADADFGENFNLNSEIKIFPKYLTIKPAEKQVVRFKVNPNKEKRGEFKSYITFIEIPPEIKTNLEEKNITSEIEVITALSVSVYGSGKDSVLDGNLKDFTYSYKNKLLNINAIAISSGNTSLKFDYSLEVLDSNLKSKGHLGNSLRTGENKISTSIQLSEKYEGKKGVLTITDQNGKIYYKETLQI